MFTLTRSGTETERRQQARRKALEWAKRVYTIGARLPRNVVRPTPETAGYFIPTFCEYGETEVAIRIARWEVLRQRPDGSFAGEDGIPYTFDTAQVIRGFLAVVNDLPEVTEPLQRACDYVESQIDADGRVRTASYDGWRLADGSVFSDYAHLYALYPLLHAGRALGRPRYVEAARRGITYFKQKPDLTEFKPQLGTLSHIFGYMMEALVELDEIDLAKRGLQSAAAIQRSDGAVPAYPGASWVCSTGVAQLAVAWYRLGERAPADRALEYLVSIQNASGGFYGGYGNGAQYFPDQEIGWAVKYFLDAQNLKEATPLV